VDGGWRVKWGGEGRGGVGGGGTDGVGRMGGVEKGG